MWHTRVVLFPFTSMARQGINDSSPGGVVDCAMEGRVESQCRLQLSPCDASCEGGGVEYLWGLGEAEYLVDLMDLRFRRCARRRQARARNCSSTCRGYSASSLASCLGESINAGLNEQTS